jgi:hypothetical protein
MYAAGLSAEFADAVLQGLLLAGSELPAGVLVIDRGALDDEGWSSVIFRQAAQLIRGSAFGASVGHGSDKERVRGIMTSPIAGAQSS